MLRHRKYILHYISLCFAELNIGNTAEVAADDRRLCIDGDMSEADGMTEAVNHNSSIDVETSPYDVTVSRQPPDGHHVCTSSSFAPLSPGASSIRHSASDSLVYRADVELASSCDGRQTAQVTSSAGVNGCCTAAEETSVSQVRLSLNY